MDETARGSDDGRAPAAGRREFIRQLGGAGAFAAFGTAVIGGEAAAQAKPPVDPAGTVPNATAMAGKHPAMKPHSDRPLTASMPAEHMDDVVTPTDKVFVRNNLFMPVLDETTHRLRIDGLVDRPVELSVADLRSRFAATELAGMLECAGSGRTGFNPVPRGTPWPVAAGMSCPRWHGVRLGDVLRAAGLKPGAVHVAFTGADFGVLPTVPKVARSVPLAKALDPDSLVAWGMNAPLPVVHGFPLRVVIPGWAGSASVKWVAHIEVRDQPLPGPYMDASYRIPRVPVPPGDRMPPDAVSTEDWPVKSILFHPAPGAKFRLGTGILVAGHAWVGAGRVERVDVSFDEGVTWSRAALEEAVDRFAWRRFSFSSGRAGPGFHTVLARAADDRGHVQPIATPWNPLGYFWNGVHRVGFMVEA